ncbi:hypothetical protein GWN42_30130 [candidate division KSB1 bacterium]|nr:hypothetical protein [candidate division KSB1 bacterium]NIS27532.1 hypothetical protein [candidate division KSB1 bacterium]NIU28250.1 hypothetical protein [candidate division KSB1 bacterium]NIU91135.1 hypothetical protein [candidate division KSB1 bacterium]NIV96931.1 hypothetical protein [candidate division KSB1 bacterium]
MFDPNLQHRPQPVITSLVPADSALAGVGQVLINGQNFSKTPEENLVFFDEETAEVLSATNQQLTVKTPQLLGDSIKIRVAVRGAQLFSKPAIYKLIPAVSDFSKIFEGAIVYGIASDLSGNVYYFANSESFGPQIFKANPSGEAQLFATPNILKANAMKIGPGETLYVVPSGRVRKISTFAPDGTENTYTTLPISPQDLDFDSNGNIWVVGGSSLARVKPDKSSQIMATVSIDGLLTVRVYSNYVYIGGVNSSSDEKKIWRYEIQGETLGVQELVLDVTSASWLAGAAVQTFTFSENADMILGTTHPEGLFIMTVGGSDGQPLYPGLLLPEIYAMTWAESNTLYAVRQRRIEGQNSFDFSQIYKITMTTNGAPYYGRQ